MDDGAQLDDLASFNRARWNELADAGVAYSRPMLDLDPASAWHMLDGHGVMRRVLGDVRGRDVLCLAAGGGQQSVAFALLGANVTVVDLSDAQLERDRQAATHYGLAVATVQGDMRDLSRFDADAFDIVYQTFSINFVPDVTPVHAGVARVVRPGGLYCLTWSNPFTQTVDETTWNGDGYLLRLPYEDGRELTPLFPHWDVTQEDGNQLQIESPKEFVHGLAAMVNSLVAHGFFILHVSEIAGDEADPEPGSWPHFMNITVPYLTLWTRHLSGFVQNQPPEG